MSTNLEYRQRKNREKEKVGRQASEAQREKELERERKNKGDSFCWKNNMNVATVRKWEMLAPTRVKMGDVRHFLHKICNHAGSFWKIHFVFVQTMYTKQMCCTCKVTFFLIRLIVAFSPFSLPSPLSITRFYILFEQTINIIESFALAVAKSIYYLFLTTTLPHLPAKVPKKFKYIN